MALKIVAPEIEDRLRRTAASRGVSAADYAVRLLSAGLPADAGASESSESLDAWLQAFHGWVNGHKYRTPLPESATTRANFYPEEER